jgi:LuxR family maltose regulon positive regulatory protein
MGAADERRALGHKSMRRHTMPGQGSARESQSEVGQSMMTPPGPGTVLAAKLRPPLLRSEHVSRPRLLRLLDYATTRRLTLIDAPAGSGKSTLLAEFCQVGRSERQIAWVSLDEQDNDPIVFWLYIIHAFQQTLPEHFTALLSALSQPGLSLTGNVLPSLLNELWTITDPLVLILDDYHLIGNDECHETLRFFLGRLPACVRVVIATRVDPPLGLGGLRGRGELSELRAADLAFRKDEVGLFFSESQRLDLTAEDLDHLTRRTEGWAAGLYLAALSLQNRENVQTFIAEFAGDHRHIVDYLGGEVLDRLATGELAFLTRTSLFESFTPSLCDAVVEEGNAAERLRALAATNQFLIPLDDRHTWYRYHHLFRELLQVELQRSEPDLIPILHQRAAAWYLGSGDAAAAMHHALAAGDLTMAGDLFLEHAQPYLLSGRRDTVGNWMARLPDDAIAARPVLALAMAWAVASITRPPIDLERWLSIAESGTDDGPLPLGEQSVRASAALCRALCLRSCNDVGGALQAGRLAVELETNPAAQSYLIARSALGQALYMAGQPDEARVMLEEAIRAPLADRQVASLCRATATLAMVHLDLGEAARAEDLARRAVELCEANGLGGHAEVWFSYVTLSTVLVQRGMAAEAESLMAFGVEPHMYEFEGWPISFAQALLALALVRSACGHTLAAQSLIGDARAAIARCKDPGILPDRLVQLESRLNRVPRRIAGLREPLSEGELRILRLLTSDLSQREIGREMYLSVNTIKTHTRSIYTKLDVASRSEAVTRARSLGLIA